MDEGLKKSVQEASAWVVELDSGEATKEQIELWQQWLKLSEENRIAWKHVENLKSNFQNVPASAVHSSVQTADDKARLRRSLLKSIAALAVLTPIGYSGYRKSQFYAEILTGVGQIKSHKLADDSVLMLNTDTAIDVAFDRNKRQILLKQGEVLISTSKGTDSRPFIVQTKHGTVRALGTRFNVFSNSVLTRVDVFEHAVEIVPTNNPSSSVVLQAGGRIEFNNNQTLSEANVPENSIAWSRGVLVVNDWSLDQFVSELSRYRRGYLRCGPEASRLRISGSFPLQNTDKILAALPEILPVKISYLTRYWVTVDSR